MADSLEELTYSERLRDAAKALVPEAVRTRTLGFLGRFVIDGEINFTVGYAPDTPVYSIDVYEQSDVNYLAKSVVLDAITAEVYSYSSRLGIKDDRQVTPPFDMSGMSNPFGEGLITVEQEAYFLNILSGDS